MTLGYQFGLCSERYFIFLLLVSPGYFISVHLETDSVVTTSSTMATGMCLDIAKCQLQHLCSLHFQVSKPRSLPSSSVSPSPIKEAESQGADTSAYVAFATLGQIQAQIQRLMKYISSLNRECAKAKLKRFMYTMSVCAQALSPV